MQTLKPRKTANFDVFLYACHLLCFPTFIYIESFTHCPSKRLFPVTVILRSMGELCHLDTNEFEAFLTHRNSVVSHRLKITKNETKIEQELEGKTS